MSEEFIFLDLETTGLSATADRIIEAGAIRSNVDGVELGTFNVLVNPGIEVPEKITQLTGISTIQTKVNGIPPETAIKRFMEFVGDAKVVAFNADFDKSFLIAETQRAGLNIKPPPFVCALQAAKNAWPILRRHNLKALATFFQIDNPEHRALSDCRIGCNIFLRAANVIWSGKTVEFMELENICITSIDAEGLYSCNHGERLSLWTRPDFPRINAYAPGSIMGSGLVLSLEKARNQWLVDQMNQGKVTELRLEKPEGQPYEVYPVLSD